MKYINCSLTKLVEEEDLAGIVVKAEDSCAKGPDRLPSKAKSKNRRTKKNQPGMRRRVVQLA